MVQLSELLHLVVVHVDPALPAADVAEAVSARYGRTLTTEGLDHLVTTRLEPLGLVLPAEAEEPIRPVRARPLLALTLKATLFPAHRTQAVARMLRPLFWPPVVAAGLVALVVADLALVVGGDFWRAVSEVFATPTTALLIYGLLVVSAVVHELGHAAACRYGGAEPGEIGVGIYIVFPAFSTDVTDSYRLGRAGRVRTDLGGLYFNVLTVVAFALLYVATGSGLWLLTALGLQLQMLQQLIPVVRFDGYYVLSDLAGVPDLFARVGPVLRSLRPGQPPDPRVTELRPQARRFVTAWVLRCRAAADGSADLGHRAPAGLRRSRPGGHPAAAAGLRPGLAAPRLGRHGPGRRVDRPDPGPAGGADGRAVANRRHARRARARAGRGLGRGKEHSMSTDLPDTQRLAAVPPAVLSAADFTDAIMYAPPVPTPRGGWRRAVYESSGTSSTQVRARPSSNARSSSAGCAPRSRGRAASWS